jgi:hypothetical protein
MFLTTVFAASRGMPRSIRSVARSPPLRFEQRIEKITLLALYALQR